MKTTKLIALLVLFSLGIQAQSLKTPTTTEVKKADQSVQTGAVTTANQASIGSLIGQMTNNISDDAFTDSFKKDKSDFIKKADNIQDPAGASSALQTLQDGLLPTALNAGWGAVKGKWLQDSKSAKTIQDVAGLTGTLESNINPKVFKGEWAKVRPGWQTALKTLSK